MSLQEDWPDLAACKNGDPDALFVPGAEQNVAKRICRRCPVRYECLADALDNRIEFGVWGGMTERERRALLRRYPTVPSWRRQFEASSLIGTDLVVGAGQSGVEQVAAIASLRNRTVRALAMLAQGEAPAPQPRYSEAEIRERTAMALQMMAAQASGAVVAPPAVVAPQNPM